VSLVEKLCYRFRTTQDVAQWRNFAHCLTLLPYNDKCVKKLQSQLACFQATLSDEEVYDCFVVIISKARKFASVDMKDAVAEFEEKIAEIHAKATEDDVAFQKASKASQKVAKAKKKKGAKATRGGRSGRVSAVHDDAEDTENAPPSNEQSPQKIVQGKVRASRRQIVSDSEDDDLLL
jgi:condensin complex subunit 1